MTSRIARRVDRLRANTVSGALDLAVEAIDIALAAPQARGELAREFQAMHPAIVTVANVGRLLAKGAAEAELAALRRSLVEGNRLIASHVARLVPPTARVITLSHSSTVEAALSGRPGRVCVLESLPGGEGRTLAEKLGAALVADAAMGQVVPSIDCALVGIDAYDRSGAILHKVGTLPLALCCAHFGKPFYAAGHSFKLSPTDTARLPESAVGAGSLFDRTPPELIAAIVTERGSAGELL